MIVLVLDTGCLRNKKHTMLLRSTGTATGLRKKLRLLKNSNKPGRFSEFNCDGAKLRDSVCVGTTCKASEPSLSDQHPLTSSPPTSYLLLPPWRDLRSKTFADVYCLLKLPRTSLFFLPDTASADRVPASSCVCGAVALPLRRLMH